jgi:signal transduction histidine kinase
MQPAKALDERVDILLVDDQPASLVALEATLERLGERIHTAESGREALRILLERDFAVILLDVMMPVMDGFETARLIRERPRSAKTPIIFLTGLTEGELPLFQAYEVGAVDYLIKPFEPAILRSKVSVFVELARKTQQVKQAAEALAEARRNELERTLLRQQMETGRDQERWLEAILDMMPTPLVLLNPAPRTTVFANWAANALAGGAFTGRQAPPEGFICTDVFGRVMAPELMPAYRAARGERLIGTQLSFAGPFGSGTVLAYSERLGAVFGHPETVMLTLLDITDLKHTEARLEESVRAREDFLAVASHELRTPLTALQIQVSNAVRSWSRKEVAANPKDHAINYLNQIQSSVVRLARLSDYLLDVSRINAGSLELRRSKVDLGALVAEVVLRLEVELTTAGCVVNFAISEEIIGNWDRVRLDQAITNLLTNALKYAGGSPVEITATADDRNARLVVRDHGRGISPEHQARLFARFDRVDAPEDVQGFGLGLWIVDQIAARHGGKVEVESSVGDGAAFTLSLPLQLEEELPRGAVGPTTPLERNSPVR